MIVPYAILLFWPAPSIDLPPPPPCRDVRSLLWRQMMYLHSVVFIVGATAVLSTCEYNQCVCLLIFDVRVMIMINVEPFKFIVHCSSKYLIKVDVLALLVFNWVYSPMISYVKLSWLPCCRKRYVVSNESTSNLKGQRLSVSVLLSEPVCKNVI